MLKSLPLLLLILICTTGVFATTQYILKKGIPEPVSEEVRVDFTEYLQTLEGNEIPYKVASYYVEKDGFEKTFQTLMEVRPHCHTEAHTIGRAFYAQSKNLGETVMQCGRSCTDGCFHGVVMGLFSSTDEHTHAPDEPEHDPHPILTEDNREAVERTLLTLCDDTTVVNVTNGRRGDCAHAIGHAALFVTGYDTPAAIELCKKFSVPGEQYYCVTGVYMERNATAADEDNAQSLYHPCELEKEFPAACYRYELQEIHDKKLATQEDVLTYCQSLTDITLQRGCFHGHGFAYHYYVQTNLPYIATLCQYGDSIAQELCVEGAIGAAGNQVPEIIAEACTYLPERLHTACMVGVEEHSFGLKRDFSRYVNLDSE